MARNSTFCLGCAARKLESTALSLQAMPHAEPSILNLAKRLHGHVEVMRAQGASCLGLCPYGDDCQENAGQRLPDTSVAHWQRQGTGAEIHEEHG